MPDSPPSDDGRPNVPAKWKPSKAEPIPVVRCTTIKANGERCKRWSLRGTTVCVKHGGNLPNVQESAAALVEAARLRIIGLSDMAIDVIEELAMNGEAEGIRLKAAQDLLDRSGVKGAIEVEVNVSQDQSPAQRVAARLASLGARAAAGELVATPSSSESEALVDVVDAELDD